MVFPPIFSIDGIDHPKLVVHVHDGILECSSRPFQLLLGGNAKTCLPDAHGNPRLEDVLVQAIVRSPTVEQVEWAG